MTKNYQHNLRTFRCDYAHTANSTVSYKAYMAVSNNAGIFDATCLNDDALLHLSADQRPTLCSPLSVSVCCYPIFRYFPLSDLRYQIWPQVRPNKQSHLGHTDHCLHQCYDYMTIRRQCTSELIVKQTIYCTHFSISSITSNTM